MLVVDDDEPIRHLVRVVLRDIADVDEVGTAMEALAHDREFTLSLILVDARLPDMSGRDVAVALKKQSGRPIVMISGDQESDAIADSDAIDGYLRKPFDIEALRETVRGYINGD